MRNTLTSVFMIVALAMSGRVVAQGDTDCITTLSHAESEFAAGRFYGIPGLLEECLSNNRFSNEEKVRVYMLLTQVYLLTDNPQAADDAYLLLLKANPEFVPSDLDPVDVIYLSKKFTSRPIFTPHIKAGGNISSQAVIYNQNVISTPDSTQIRHRALPGWTAGGGIEWNITDNVGVGIEALISQKKFRTDIDHLFKHDNYVGEERQLWLDIPMYVRYGWHRGNIRPFVYAGGSVNLLLMSKLEESYNDRTEGTGSESDKVTPYAQPPRNISYKRNFFNRSLVFGGGTKIKIGQDFLLVDVRYMPGLSNVTNMKYNNYASKERTALDPSTSQFGSIGDVFRVNNMAISLGYVRPLYNPRRATRVNTRSVSKRLNRRDKEDEK